MSKPRYRWWGYALKVVRDYPKLLAADHLTVDDQKDRDAVAQAIEQIRQGRHGEETLQLIKHVYWDGSARRIEDAAMRLHISESTAKRWHREFIRAVGRGLGFSVAADKGAEHKAESGATE